MWLVREVGMAFSYLVWLLDLSHLLRLFLCGHTTPLHNAQVWSTQQGSVVFPRAKVHSVQNKKSLSLVNKVCGSISMMETFP